MTRVAVATLGCKVNQFESEALMGSLEERGYCLVPFGEKADITIVNTCTVTQRADFQSRQMLRRAVRSSPGSLLIVIGCYAQVEAEKIATIEGVSYLLGNGEKNKIPDLLPLMQKGEPPQIQVSDMEKEILFRDLPLHSFHRHTRAFLKVQDGCNAQCSYCIVPLARGRSRSLSPERVVEHLREWKERGFKEVVLTGIHLGAYGLDLMPRSSLEELLERVEGEETPLRIRLSSVEPLDFSPGLISLVAQSPKICPHLHIPVQSGDDEILKKMKRNYDSSFVSHLIQELHGRISGLSIGVDLIAGFPGETGEQFERTYRLVESLPLSYLHVFPFSRRKGTSAFHMRQRVDEREIKRRAERLRVLGREKRQAFYRQFLHQEVDVLVENRREKGSERWKGLSRNYIPILLSDEGKLEAGRDWVNQELRVKVTELTENGLVGQVAGR